MTQITLIDAANVAQMIEAGLPACDAPSAERPMLEVHNESRQAYPRTIANYQRTRRMACELGTSAVAKLDRTYTVYQLVQK